MFGKEALRKAFKEFDTSGDGKITLDEFVEALVYPHGRGNTWDAKEFTVEDATKLFDLVDVNNDGVIEYKEFVDRWAGPFNKRSLMLAKKSLATDKKAAIAMYNAIDKDGTGNIERDEIRKILRYHGDKMGLDFNCKEIGALFKKYDVDDINEGGTTKVEGGGTAMDIKGKGGYGSKEGLGGLSIDEFLQFLNDLNVAEGLSGSKFSVNKDKRDMVEAKGAMKVKTVKDGQTSYT